MSERGVDVDHSTINRWVDKYAPNLKAEFAKQYKNKISCSWRFDETYIKIKGQWCYLYRVVDKSGATIDFMLSKYRDKTAAKSFLIKAFGKSGKSEKVTIDKSGSNNSALKLINENQPESEEMLIRQIKYLNNIVEQDHRSIKKITKPMMGLKAFHSANATLVGIEFLHMLRKRQHEDSKNMTVPDQFYALSA